MKNVPFKRVILLLSLSLFAWADPSRLKAQSETPDIAQPPAANDASLDNAKEIVPSVDAAPTTHPVMTPEAAAETKPWYPHRVKDPALGNPPYDLTLRLGDDVWFWSYGFLQARWTGNHRDDMTGASGDEFTSAWNIPRARLHFNIGVTKYLDFFLRAGVRSGGAMGIEQAFANINLGNVRLRVGQFFAVLVMEEDPDPHRLQSADFSQVANTFGGGQVPGVEARWTVNEFLRVYAITTNGLRTGFGEVNGPNNAKYAFMGRIETKPIHTKRGWDQFLDRSGWRGSELGMRLGVSGHHQKMSDTYYLSAARLSVVSVDADIKGNGWNFFANGVWQHLQNAGVGNNAYGVFAQAGVFLTPVIEIAGAYDAVLSDGKPYPIALGGGGNGTGDYHSVIGTINYYLTPNENRAKLQLDAIYAFNPVGPSLVTPAPNAGVLANQAGAQQAVRLNLMVAY